MLLILTEAGFLGTVSSDDSVAVVAVVMILLATLASAVREELPVVLPNAE